MVIGRDGFEAVFESSPALISVRFGDAGPKLQLFQYLGSKL